MNSKLQQLADEAWVAHVRGHERQSMSWPAWAEYSNRVPPEVFEGLFKEAFVTGLRSVSQIDTTDLNKDDVMISDAAIALKDALPGLGYILMVTKINMNPEQSREPVAGRYVANVNRKDAIAVLKTLLFRWGINDEWMKDAV
jgi:hypothetical protein